MGSESSEEKIDRLIRLPELKSIVGLRKSTLYQMMKLGKFPAGIVVGRSRLWKLSSIQDWMDKL